MAVWPSWHDAGKCVRVVHGEVTTCGVLRVDDYFFDGEDEVPLFVVETKDGRTISFADADRWDYATW